MLKRHLTKTNICFALLCIIFAGFFFIPKSPHRIIFYVLLICSLWTYKDALNIQSIKIYLKQLFTTSKLTCLFFGYCVVTSLILSITEPEEVFNVIKKALFVFLFISILITMLKTPSDWQKLLFVYVLSSLIIGLGICILHYGIEGKSFLIRTDRYWGIGRGVNPNVGGLLYGLAAIIAYTMYQQWGFLKYKGKDYRFVFMCAAVAVCALIVLATQSRGTIVALGLSGLVILMLQKRYKLLSAGLIVATIGFAAIVYVMGDFSDFISRADNGRFDIWSAGYALAMQHPIIGTGYGHETSFTTDLGTWRSTHNLYLGTLVYHGVIGFTLFLAFWATTFKTLYHDAHQTNDLTFPAIMIYASFFGLFEFHTLFMNLNPEWLVIWLPVAYAIYTQNQKNI